MDGFVGAGWRVERAGDRATLVVIPAVPLSASDRDAVAEEAEGLLAFLAADAGDRDVRFDAP